MRGVSIGGGLCLVVGLYPIHEFDILTCLAKARGSCDCVVLVPTGLGGVFGNRDLAAWDVIPRGAQPSRDRPGLGHLPSRACVLARRQTGGGWGAEEGEETRRRGEFRGALSTLLPPGEYGLGGA